MMTRYIAATATLLICATIQPSQNNKTVLREFGKITITRSGKPETGHTHSRKSNRLATKERLEKKEYKETIAPKLKLPVAYTSPSQCMIRKNGEFVPSRKRKKMSTLVEPSLADTPAFLSGQHLDNVTLTPVEPKEDNDSIIQASVADTTTFSWRQYLNTIAPESLMFDEDSNSIEEMCDNETLPAILPATRSLPTASLTVPLPSPIHEIGEHNTAKTRNPLLTVSSGSVTKPRRTKANKGISQSMPELEHHSTSPASHPSLPKLRNRDLKKTKNHKITAELVDLCTQFNTAVETITKKGHPLDEQAQKWHKITHSILTDSKPDTATIEGSKYQIKKWLDEIIKVKN